MPYHVAVQLRLPWDGRKTSPARNLTIDGHELTVEIVRHRWARRYVVRVAPDGAIRLTVPRGASIAGGMRFAAEQSPWISRERARQLERAAPWREGTLVWFRGERTRLCFDGDDLLCGEARVAVHGGLPVRVGLERWLRNLADAELPQRTRDLAAACGVRVARVSVRNQRSRWGACSPGGVITLNWRLVQMPPSVRDYVILHELMHVRQPNHSRRFWREVESVCSWWRDAERWLRQHGREIL